jgi:pilus assembly protein CpaB
MQRPGTIFLLSIVLGALFSALVYRYLREQQSAVEQARLSAKGATVDVVVADTPIPVGTRIEPAQLRVAKWPIELEPQGAVRAVDQAAGSIARVSIDRNQPLQQSTLVPKGAGLLPLLITDGMRGMSVRVDSVTGVSGFITPNSRVDVLVSGNPSNEGAVGEQKGKVILQNVRVLATGKEIEQKDEKPVEVPTVTLLVSPEDAEKLTIATRQEAVRLTLRNYRDEDIVPTAGIALKTLFQPDPGAKGAPQSSAPADKAPRTRSGGGGVQILLGDKVTRQPLY